MDTKTNSELSRRVNIALCKLLSLSFSLVLFSCGGEGGDSAESPASTGTGGSTARMTISGNYLYAIADADIQLFDISTPSSPNPWVNVRVAWNIETLFPYNDYLLIGAADALHIMDNTNPGRPELLTTMPHATAQDPVVAENDVAYVTLRNAWNRESPPPTVVGNELLVIGLQNMANPTLIDVIPMQHPGGLSVENDLLFVCDGIAGIKIFDTSDSSFIVSLTGIRDVQCNDLIAKDQRLYVITDNSILQYDISVFPPVLLSEVSGA